VKPLHVYFELSALDVWHRKEWENRLAAADPAKAIPTTRPNDADCILSPSTPWHFSEGGRCFGLVASNNDHASRFVWDQGDLPSGYERGFYCSLPRSLFDQRRHRTCHYAIQYNECIEPGDLSEARKLVGFVGGITSGLRSRLISHLRSLSDHEVLCEEQRGPWTQMFDRSGLQVKQHYAKTLRSCRFFLCPRGNGVGSVRLFETMQAARVPVILSDSYVLPPGIDWPNCSVRVREKDMCHLPRLLRERESEWACLATSARREWEAHFSDKQFLSTLATGLHSLRDAAVDPPPSHALRRLTFLAALKSRRGAGRFKMLLRRLSRSNPQ
jgi:hypothetical protein